MPLLSSGTRTERFQQREAPLGVLAAALGAVEPALQGVVRSRDIIFFYDTFAHFYLWHWAVLVIQRAH
jgi:hypothetical protein